MTNYRCIVMSNPVPGREDEYNDWYDNRHMDDVLSIPGFVRVQRFEYAASLSGESSGFKYLSIYEIDSDDIVKTIDELTAAAGTSRLPISEALDTTVHAFVYRARGMVKHKPTP